MKENVYISARAGRPSRWRAAFLGLATFAACAAASECEFADGRIRCLIGGDANVLSAAAIAMATALRTLPPPEIPATLAIRPLSEPRFYRRWFGAPAAHGWQSGDEIAFRPDPDPVRMAFRLAHEISHWLVAKTNPQRPPLWLDEGLAQRIGAQAAAIAGRTEKRGLARTPPGDWKVHAFSLDALVSLAVAPSAPGPSGAFYWQAERLVEVLFERLGRDDFLAYLAILSSSPLSDWQAPLRERWWFNDADFEALARAIAPYPTEP